MFLSIIIPAYNEEKRIEKTLFDLRDYLKRQSFDYEVIIINDGSKDKTNKIIKRIVGEWKNYRIIGYQKNRGKGAAVKYGVQHSRGDRILFVDADGSTPPDEFESFKPYLDKFQIIIGSRHLVKSYVKRRQPASRILVARLSNLIIRLILGLNFKDTQCGFKLFERTTATKLFSKMTLQRWGFDFEILALAKKYRFKVKEVPVVWYNEKGSAVKPVAVLKTFFELFKVRWNLWSGKY